MRIMFGILILVALMLAPSVGHVEVSPCQVVRACDSCYPRSAALLAIRWKTIGKRSHLWPFAWAAELIGQL